jgi:peptidoglycan/LPS O-acetylase OafA/YrhL
MVLSTKPHYPILDGLRGVAGLLVVVFHLLGSHPAIPQSQALYHGYLAVDFFFLLSGYVIGYAYDDRWNRMNLGSFLQRRLVRLQPMVVLGMVVGGLTYYFWPVAAYPVTGHPALWKVLLFIGLGSLLIPAPARFDLRGWQEAFPLNAPGWSLMYEYVANFLYAVLVRRFSQRSLTALVVVSGAALGYFLLISDSGSVAGGWTLNAMHIRIGLLRVTYPFFAGLLLYRIARPRLVTQAMWLSILLVTLVMVMPRIGTEEQGWINGLYEALCILLVFPLVVYLGTCKEQLGATERRLCKWLGDISYPIYITHYPLVYIYSDWAHKNHIGLRQGLPWAALTFAIAVLLAYGSLKFYDEPVRRWLSSRLLASPSRMPVATHFVK